jgi:sRNA-binding carbon storage regulator CsrA
VNPVLVLTRREGQVTFITAPNGDRIKIVNYDFDRGKCRLGIDAPREYTIDREEIDQRKREATNGL